MQLTNPTLIGKSDSMFIKTIEERIIIYNLQCQICYNVYDFRVIDNHKNITRTLNGEKPDVDNLEMKTTEGICEKCRPDYFKNLGLYGLIAEYHKLRKRTI